MRAIGLSSLLVMALGWALPAHALPMYAQRSGRTCANCHVSPTYEDAKGWHNPELSKRKCSMSCNTCHTNPAGGGLRNTSGRYYGQSTLSILPVQERSYSDVGREILPASWIKWTRQLFEWEASPPQRSSDASPGEDVPPDNKTIPSDWDEVRTGVGSGKRGGFAALGRPLFGPSEYALWDGRYGDLRADPLFQVGGDLRSAYWSASNTVFPMQLDLHTSVHPIEHLTFMTTVAGRGRVGGFEQAFAGDLFPVFVRNGFVMVHELPYMSYVKAGIFMPSFGTHLDDHTSFIRDFHEMDVSTSDDTVLGVEIGAAPNYPYASLSVFTNWVPIRAPGEGLTGMGVAANFGWRDLGWSLTGHVLVKRRPLVARGNMEAGGIGWGFNPAYYLEWLPLTYMGELTFGGRQLPVTGARTWSYAMYHELWWTVVNGISVRFKVDLGNRDAEVAADTQHRYTLGVDISPVPGLTLIAQARYLDIRGFSPAHWDAFVTTHVWF